MVFLSIILAHAPLTIKVSDRVTTLSNHASKEQFQASALYAPMDLI